MAWFDCGCCSNPSRRRALRAGLVAAGAALAAPVIGRAQAQAVPGARERVINTHAHYYNQEFLDLLGANGQSHGAGYRREADGFFMAVNGVSYGPLPFKFIDLQQRIATMDAQGVSVQAISLSTPMVYWADPALSARLSQAWNDGASAAHTQYPDRLVALMTLPLLDTDRALRELDRARALPGMKGVYMGTNIDSHDLSDPRFLPVFQAIERAGLPVFLHPIQTVGGARLQPYYLNNLLGNPIDTAIAAAHLIFGGVLDACPTLEVNLPHAGGVLPILTGRLDHGRAVRPELRHMTHPPSDYMRRFTYDTISLDPAIMRFVIQQVGIDRVTVGDDYCYDMGEPEPVQFVDQLQLSAADRTKVLSANAARLLRL